MSEPAPSRQQTRDSLVRTARTVFARDGYHAASLAVIAREAGFSKGAVYSNFDSKAQLFLALMDDDARDSSARWARSRGADERLSESEQASRQGMGLATLEFIAAAARDDRVAAQIDERMALTVRAHGSFVREQAASDVRPAGGLDPDTAGALVFALQQGVSLLALAGSEPIGPAALDQGMRALTALADPQANTAALSKDDSEESPGFQQSLLMSLARSLGHGQS